MKDFARIDRLRLEWGDKYVEADAGVPSLRRFAGKVGRVMTINMNGRALVQFSGTNDIGWYDIDLVHLRRVAEPALAPQATTGPARPKAPPRDVEAGAVANVRLASAEAVAESEAPDPPPKKAFSTADILAAARQSKTTESKSPGAAERSQEPSEKPPATARPKLSTADILAAARKPKPPASASPEESLAPAKPKLSTAEILAAARQGNAAKPEAPVPQRVEAAEAESPVSAAAPKKLSTAEILAAARAGKAKPATSEALTPAPQGESPTTETPAAAMKKPTTEEILALARQKKTPGAESQPGKNPPERRSSAPDLGEEEST